MTKQFPASLAQVFALVSASASPNWRENNQNGVDINPKLAEL
ncbi:MAG: hypothetical protein WBM24_15980 [Candidatus Sulfotelmatobacter sp.]